jgi:hypothetical protein
MHLISYKHTTFVQNPHPLQEPSSREVCEQRLGVRPHHRRVLPLKSGASPVCALDALQTVKVPIEARCNILGGDLQFERRVIPPCLEGDIASANQSVFE